MKTNEDPTEGDQKLDPVKPSDRRTLNMLAAVINDPDTSPEDRAECREEFHGIAEGYLDVLEPDEERIFLIEVVKRAAADLAWAQAQLAQCEAKIAANEQESADAERPGASGESERTTK